MIQNEDSPFCQYSDKWRANDWRPRLRATAEIANVSLWKRLHAALASQDPDLPRRVADLIRGRHQLPYLARAVSGTELTGACSGIRTGRVAGLGVRASRITLAFYVFLSA